uniref:Uncharacterized protein n=1 Tax=Pyxicephalus adspersus TaxID=30357 RepID=A0AAV3A8L3_PYXAD|nr:TPA: hypothetical protein GDO54_014391 [Pyxicephalus adspersus]
MCVYLFQECSGSSRSHGILQNSVQVAFLNTCIVLPKSTSYVPIHILLKPHRFGFGLIYPIKWYSGFEQELIGESNIGFLYIALKLDSMLK